MHFREEQQCNPTSIAPTSAPARRLEDAASKAEGAAELQARVDAAEAARADAEAARAAALQQLAITQQALDRLIEALAQREQYERLREHHMTGGGGWQPRDGGWAGVDLGGWEALAERGAGTRMIAGGEVQFRGAPCNRQASRVG